MADGILARSLDANCEESQMCRNDRRLPDSPPPFARRAFAGLSQQSRRAKLLELGRRGTRSLDYGLRRGGASPGSGGNSLFGLPDRRFCRFLGFFLCRRLQLLRRYFCHFAGLFGGFLGLFEFLPGLFIIHLGPVRLIARDLDLFFYFGDPDRQVSWVCVLFAVSLIDFLHSGFP